MKVEFEIVPQLNSKKADDVLNNLDKIESEEAEIHVWQSQDDQCSILLRDLGWLEEYHFGILVSWSVRDRSSKHCSYARRKGYVIFFHENIKELKSLKKSQRKTEAVGCGS